MSASRSINRKGRMTIECEMTRDEKLNEIAFTLEYWLQCQKRDYERQGCPLTDDSHLIAPPYWPTRGMLKEWIKALRGA